MESHFWLSFGRHHTTSSGSAETWVPRVGGRSPQLHWLVIRHELIPNDDCPLILGPRKSAGFFILTRPISYHAICEHFFWDILERAPQAKWIHYSLTHFWISFLWLELLLGSLLKMLESGKWALWEAGFSISFFFAKRYLQCQFCVKPVLPVKKNPLKWGDCRFDGGFWGDATLQILWQTEEVGSRTLARRLSSKV